MEDQNARRPAERIKEEFDRIAVLSERRGDHGGAYDDFIFDSIPGRCGHALEIGCGTGSFTRRLATKADRVTAIDLSDEMIRLARQHSTGYSNIDYRVADLLKTELPAAGFDCVVTIATLHHLPLAAALDKIRGSLVPGGTLVIHDILESSGVFDRAMDVLRVLTARFGGIAGGARTSRQLRKAWAEHGKGERYLTMREVERIRDEHLAGASVKRHLLWRYSVIWRGPCEMRDKPPL